MLDIILGLFFSGIILAISITIKFTIVFCILIFKVMLYPFYIIARLLWH